MIFPHMPDMPEAVTRDGFLHQLDALLKKYQHRWYADPAFKARGSRIGRFLEHLDYVHQLGDSVRAGFLVASMLEEIEPTRELQREAWNEGMAAAKLAALGIKPARNPYEGEA